MFPPSGLGGLLLIRFFRTVSLTVIPLTIQRVFTPGRPILPREVVTHPPYTSFGGDLKGIISKLPYLSELGIELIYLTPIFAAPTMHKYDVRDYLMLDPNLGGTWTICANWCKNALNVESG